MTNDDAVPDTGVGVLQGSLPIWEKGKRAYRISKKNDGQVLNAEANFIEAQSSVGGESIEIVIIYFGDDGSDLKGEKTKWNKQ